MEKETEDQQKHMKNKKLLDILIQEKKIKEMLKLELNPKSTKIKI